VSVCEFSEVADTGRRRLQFVSRGLLRLPFRHVQCQVLAARVRRSINTLSLMCLHRDDVLTVSAGGRWYYNSMKKTSFAVIFVIIIVRFGVTVMLTKYCAPVAW